MEERRRGGGMRGKSKKELGDRLKIKSEGHGDLEAAEV